MWLLYATKNNTNSSQVSDWKMVMFFNEDARTKFLEDNSVDLFILNPPLFVDTVEDRYGGDLSKQLKETNYEGYLKALIEITKNLEAALKDTGSIIMMMPNTPLFYLYMTTVSTQVPLWHGRVRIWNWGDGFDYVVHLHKKSPYVNPEHAVPDVFFQNYKCEEEVGKYYRFGDVSGATPEAIYEMFIKNYSKKGDVVADIFAGTGTGAVVALKNNRRYIYNDASSVQLEIAKARINDATNNF